jgi:hypothetical protein
MTKFRATARFQPLGSECVVGNSELLLEQQLEAKLSPITAGTPVLGISACPTIIRSTVQSTPGQIIPLPREVYQWILRFN